MKKINLIVLICLASLIAVSCISRAVHQSMWGIRKGLPSREVLRIIGNDSGFDLKPVNKKNINELIMPFAGSDKFTVIVTKKEMIEEKRYFIFVFQNDKLLYWGTPNEFARHTSPLINETGMAAVKLFIKK